jgi:O-antigen/teichoic acid export membrane protein
MPPVLGRLLRGTFWLALKSPLQIVLAFWSVPLVQHYIGKGMNGAYLYAWGWGFVQFLLEFGMSSALQRQISDSWTRGDRDGVNRAVACGTAFYAAAALAQAAFLLIVAYVIAPYTDYYARPAEYALIVKLLWLQALAAPCYGLSMVAASVLQAARRFDFIPKFEMAVLLLRFAILIAGLAAGLDFFVIVAAQTISQIVLLLAPALWVMIRELGFRPHFQGARLSDWKALWHISIYMAIIQLSVVLADKLDTTILGHALRDPGPATTVYQNVSKGFLQIRQTGWMLSYMVMPAVASLVAARDERGLERVKYDGSRFLIGLLTPMAILAAIYAAPFLTLWVGAEYGAQAHLMQLFLVATLPLIISVPVQMSIGMGKIEVVAISALLGSLVNLPLSFYLTTQIGVAGVIWGTVLTTLISNGLVPAAYVFRVLDVRPTVFLRRTLSAPVAGACALAAASWSLGLLYSANPRGAAFLTRATPLLVHLAVSALGYVVGYTLVPAGRGDLAALARKLRPASLS